MLKPVVAATAVIAIAGSSLVYAQERFGGHAGMRPWGARAEHRYRPSAQDLAAFTDARIAALKAGLELTPDQAKAWPPFEQALRDLAQLRVQRIEARRALAQQGAGQSQPLQGENPDGPFARLQRRAENLAKTAAALKKVADAGAPLYQSLTGAQKERFKVLARILRPHARFVAFNERRGGWRGDRGFRPRQQQFAPGRGGSDGGTDSQL